MYTTTVALPESVKQHWPETWRVYLDRRNWKIRPTDRRSIQVLLRLFATEPQKRYLDSRHWELRFNVDRDHDDRYSHPIDDVVIRFWFNNPAESTLAYLVF